MHYNDQSSSVKPHGHLSEVPEDNKTHKVHPPPVVPHERYYIPGGLSAAVEKIKGHEGQKDVNVGVDQNNVLENKKPATSPSARSQAPSRHAHTPPPVLSASAKKSSSTHHKRRKSKSSSSPSPSKTFSI